MKMPKASRLAFGGLQVRVPIRASVLEISPLLPVKSAGSCKTAWITAGTRLAVLRRDVGGFAISPDMKYPGYPRARRERAI